MYEVLANFGHTTFRNGQEKVIMRMLCGEWDLVITVFISEHNATEFLKLTVIICYIFETKLKQEINRI